MMINRLLGLMALGIAALLIVGIVAAATSHDAPTKCPVGWKPNTGYLQHGCIPK